MTDVVLTRDVFQTVLSGLKEEAAKPQETFTLRELVIAGFDELCVIVQRHGYDRAIAIFEQQNVHVKRKTLQQYLSRFRSHLPKSSPNQLSQSSLTVDAGPAKEPMPPATPDSVGAIADAAFNRAAHSENGHQSTPPSRTDASQQPQQPIPHAGYPVAISPIAISPIATATHSPTVEVEHPTINATHFPTSEVVHQGEHEGLEREEGERSQTEGSVVALTPESSGSCVELLEDGHLKEGNLSSQSLGADVSPPSAAATAVLSPQGEVVMDGGQRPSKIAQPKLEDKVKSASSQGGKPAYVGWTPPNRDRFPLSAGTQS